MDNEPPKDYDEDEGKQTPTHVRIVESLLFEFYLFGVLVVILILAFAIFLWFST